VLKYLLDTNICVFVIRGKSQLVMHRFNQFADYELGISTLTLAELQFGADKSNNPHKNHVALDAFVKPLEVIEFDEIAAERYGTVRTELERRGMPIGPVDTLLAAHALRLFVPLVTNNVREFSRVAGLVVEDWTVP